MSSAAGDREQKMLDSTTQNLSERLTEVRKTLGTLITKVSGTIFDKHRLEYTLPPNNQ